MTDYRDTTGLRFFTESKLAEQMEREDDMVKAGKDRYDKRLKQKSTIDTAPGLKLLDDAMEAVQAQIVRSKAQQAAAGGRPRGWYSLLKTVDNEVLAWHALAGALNAAKDFTNHTTAASQLGEQLSGHLHLDAAEGDDARLVKQHEKFARKHNRDDVRKRKMSKLARDLKLEAPDWDEEACIIIGEFLIGEVEAATGMIERVRIRKPQSDHDTVKIAFSSKTNTDWEKANQILAEMLPVALPMLVQPKPWTNNDDGGLVKPHKNVKLLSEKMIKNPTGVNNLNRDVCPVTFSAITAAQDTAFTINESVRRVMQECLDKGDPIVPSTKAVPEVTTQMPKDLNEKADADMLTESEKMEFKRLCIKRGTEYSKRTKAQTDWAVFRDSLRQAWLLDDDTFFYACHVDSRGRLYYRSAHLNPQGNGIAKALLQFAEPVRLGEQGILWLMVHVANCFGADKLSYAGRIAWVEENHDEIIRCALEPMETDTLWRTLKTKERWLALAAAFEYTLMCVEGEDFESRLPIGLDGNCNGLQHLSLAIRDPITAFKVSVLPSDKPEDIYAEVKDRVNEILSKPVTAEQEIAAPVWAGKVERTFVKRPTMTLPYALSDRGRNKQIAEELGDWEERTEDDAKIVPSSWYEDEDELNPVWKAALQLSPVVLQAQEELLGRPMALLRYLKRLCDLVVSSGNDFQWTAPITNFHAVLRYFHTDDKKARTYWYNGTQKRSRKMRVEYDRPDKAGAKRAVAASITHSLDAAHLQLTVHDLWELGVDDFYLCHDSIGVHAGHCGRLHDSLQRTIYAMYNNVDIIEHLEQAAVDAVKGTKMEGKITTDRELLRYKEAMLSGDTFNLEDVLQSEYIFN